MRVPNQFLSFGEIRGCVDFNLIEARGNLFHDTCAARCDRDDDTATIVRLRYFRHKTQALLA